MTDIPIRAFTHAGVFHADDVFGSALLVMTNPDIKIQRGYHPPANFDGIVFDIGGGAFDHHGSSRSVRANGVPYASFGLLWECFGSRFLCKEDAATFDETFVQPIDNADNGGKLCCISQMVADFNPYPPAEADAYDAAFDKAVAWACGVMGRRISALQEARSVRDYVLDCMTKCDGDILVLDRFVPWKEVVVGSSYFYVIYPSVRGGFNAQAVPERPGNRSVLLPFPPDWRGASAEELRRMTRVDGLSFCHPSGHLVAVDTREGAIKVARLSLAGDWHHCFQCSQACLFCA